MMNPNLVNDIIAENRRLRHLVDSMAADLGVGAMPVRPPWGLTPQEFTILCCLTKFKWASNEMLLRAIAVKSRAQYREPKIVDVLVCKVRKKIAPFGFRITTIHGEGRELCEAGRVAVTHHLASATP